MNNFLVLCLLLISSNTFAESLLTFQDVTIGESRVEISLEDFIIKKSPEEIKIRSYFSKDSIQWVRDNSNLLTPRARLVVYVPKLDHSLTVHYGGQNFIPQIKKKGVAVDIWENLFNPGVVEIKNNNISIGKIEIHTKEKKRISKTKLIDYSCDPYNLKFEGLDNQYMSVGCRLESVGKWNKKRPRLTVTWSTTDYKIDAKIPPPYKVVFHEKGSAKVKLINDTGNVKVVTITAHLPKKLHRLKTAIGFGPYKFKTQNDSSIEKNNFAPALMIYGKYDLTSTTSLRLFDAIVKNKSYFNNGGIYLAYELASMLDGRIQILPLIGAQILSYKYDKNSGTVNNMIYPQGFEVIWKHSFNYKNLTTVYGMFLSTNEEKPYKNLWIRTGKKYFWELNYIEWSMAQNSVKTYGLSVGIPFMSFF
jgi:hypothetical protein